ncbi:gliding motility-associated C-terminal domain-containing protein [Filimonas lacunae]|uniref:Gliding motility-associated C-terminal domain-containing protein n=1 Tax=Filimonas lacunae TaxID=477680 RepID=A0A173MBC6_9BACT|nr:gliding motility-associated C-terminal domain-containing protein [Filimonas lacunae]BAV04778.1 hypothetical protein FLA_0777 [Filimonas lacunae]SIT32094.1 gliding motility-associated C-terminal domain-containing protein [Filimonas lacunae]
MQVRFVTAVRSLLLLLLLFAGMVKAVAQNCSGTPVAGTITASATTQCAGSDVTISLQGQSVNNGIALQWQSSTDNVTWKDINSATATTYTFTLSNTYPPTWYRVKVTCSNSGEVAYTNIARISYPVLHGWLTLPFTETFDGDWITICRPGVLPQPFGPFPWDNWPVLGNSSWRRDDGYSNGGWTSDFGAYLPGGSGSDHSARFHSTYASLNGYLDLFLNVSDASASASKKLSFDYINTDGLDKLVIWKSEDGGVTFTRFDSATTAATWTNKRFYFTSYAPQLVLRFMGIADTDGNSDLGIDNVHVEAVTACSGTPVAGSLLADKTEVCAAANVQLHLDGISGNTEGVVYQWESSIDNKATWAPIAGADATTYSTTQTIATYYRVTATCLFGSAATSNEVLVTVPGSVSGTFTIDKTKTTGGGNFASFNDAYNYIKCGIDGPVVFNVAAGSGVYNEQLIIDNVPGTSAVNTVTFHGNGNSILFSSNNSAERAVVKLRAASWFVFDSLLINAAPAIGAPESQMGIGVHLLKGASNNTFRKCTIITDTVKSNSFFYGVLMNGDDAFNWHTTMVANCNNNTFESDSIVGGWSNVYMASSMNGPNVGTRFTNCVFRDCYTRGVSIIGAASTYIEKNKFLCVSRQNAPVISFGIGYVYIENSSFGTYISKNVFTDPFGPTKVSGSDYSWFFGVFDGSDALSTSAGLVISNNVMYDISRCENVSGMLVNTPGAAILHNTIHINYTTPRVFGGLVGIQVNKQATGAVIRNNIITMVSNGLANSAAIKALGTTVNADNNILRITGNGPNFTGIIDNNYYSALVDWQKGSGGDAHSLDADPLYVDLDNGDLHPTEKLVNNSGATGTGVADDILGVTRSVTAPDAGAYEFTPVGCTSLNGLYTIDKNSPASDRNFTSFNAAKAALECGIDGPVVFDVKSGVYNEQLELNRVSGASAVNTVTFKGNGNTIQYSSTNTNERAVIKLKGASHIIIDSLVIDAAAKGSLVGRYGYGVQMIANADSNLITNCNILTDTTLHNNSPYFAGVVITPNDNGEAADGDTYCDGDSIIGNRISGGATSVLITGIVSNPVIKDNQVLNSTVMGIAVRCSLTAAVIEHNYLSRPYRKEPGYWGIQVVGTPLCSGVNVVRNTITDVFSSDIISGYCYAIFLSNVNNSNVNNNLLYNLHANGTAFQGITLDNSNIIITQHNTISIDGTEMYDGTSSYAFYFSGNDMGYVTNNLVSVTRIGPGRRSVMYFQQPTNGMFFEGNNYFISADAHNHMGTVGIYDDYTSLTSWQGYMHGEANTTTLPPFFKDITHGDLTPTSSLLDNTGKQRGVLVDIENRLRSTTTPDMGAIEFSEPACTAPPEAGKAVATPDAGICMGGVIALSVTGNSYGANQRYVWQKAASANGPWTAISDSLAEGRSAFSTELTSAHYFRCLVVCGGQVDSSDVVVVSMNAGMPAGVYTIDQTKVTSYPAGINFASFKEAVAAMACGIAGPVVFRVATGTYAEQVTIPKIGNASLINTVRFESASGTNTDVVLTYTASGDADNYVLKLDSASFISFHQISIVAGGADFARAVVLSGGASWDTITGCKIPLPVSAVSSYSVYFTRIAGVYAEGISGGHHVISYNQVTRGGVGVYVSGKDAAHAADEISITGNAIEQPFVAGIQVQYVLHNRIDSNQVHMSASANTTAYGINASYTDSVFHIAHNGVLLDHMPDNVTAYGIYVSQGVAAFNSESVIEGNFVKALDANAGSLYGLTVAYLTHCHVWNNVVHIATASVSGDASRALNHIGSRAYYYNNSIQNASSHAGSYTGYFYEDNVRGSVAKNNIFSHIGGGIALYIHQPDFVTSDYNTLYTSGSSLAMSTPFTAVTYTSLDAWRKASGNDWNSIVYKPAFADDRLMPDVNSADVWAIHGRGVQIAGNDHDYYGAARAVTLQEGVPDMGAYEFLPVAVPVALTAVPAAPQAGTSQVFYLGTDTVARIRWHAGSTVPSGVVMRRYSGVAPVNLAAGEKYMYFYTSAEVAGGGAVAADIEQFYVDSWQGFIDSQDAIKLGKTNASGTWQVNSSSFTDAITNVIQEKDITQLYRFTGLLNGSTSFPEVIAHTDTSNAGTEFWASYGHHQHFETDNAQDMQLMISSHAKEAHVTVTVPGTGWRRVYTVQPGNAIISEVLPKNGSYDARITEEGVFNRGVHIVSDVPVQVASMIGRNEDVNLNGAMEESGATLLLPTGTYGYEYKALVAKQFSNNHSWSWVNVIAAYDSTLVEVTPSHATKGGHQAGVTYTVLLRKGEVYQLMGQLYSATEGYDLSGTIIRSAKNASGKCYPVAVFSGSSATSAICESGTFSTSLPVDNLVQQNLPYRAWGKHYITAPAMTHHDATLPMVSVFRIMVKDVATKVAVNGVALTQLTDNLYYEFPSNQPDDIVADQPVTVAQYLLSTGGCPGTATDGANDAEMFYLTPAEHGVKKVVFFRHNIGFNGFGLDGSNSLSLVIPDEGLSSLTIDGSNGFYDVYPCNNKPGYSLVVKRWDLAGRDMSDRNATFTVESNYAFTGITYGLGVSESYGYNLGMLVDTATVISSVVPGNADTAITVCAGAETHLKTYISIKPASITWQLGAVAGAAPAGDITELSPAPKDSVVVNGVKYYQFVSVVWSSFADTGLLQVPVLITDEAIEGCGHSIVAHVPVYVAGKPFASFTVPENICIGEPVQFIANDTIASGTIQQWLWNFGNGNSAVAHAGSYTYNEAGVFDVRFTVTSGYGCKDDTVQVVTVTDCRASVFIPNAFTPNGDGKNDMLNVYGNSVQAIRMMIFNQWGQKIFETTNRDNGWDGTHKGVPQPSGVYMYVCTVKLMDGSEVVKKGAVNLVR